MFSGDDGVVNNGTLGGRREDATLPPRPPTNGASSHPSVDFREVGNDIFSAGWHVPLPFLLVNVLAFYALPVNLPTE